MIFCAARFDDPLAFVHAEAGWNRAFAWPWHLVARTVGDLWHLRFLDTSVASTDEFVSAVTMVLLVVATVSAFRHLRRSYAILLAVLTLTFACNTILESTARESLVMFPSSWCWPRGANDTPGWSGCSSPSSYRPRTTWSSGS